MHRTVARTHLKASLVVNLLYLIRLNVHVVGRSQLVVVVLRVVLLQLLLLLSSVMRVINLSLYFIFALSLTVLLLALEVL